MAEWSNAPDSKSGIPVSGIVGSNPTLSATSLASARLSKGLWFLPTTLPTGSREVIEALHVDAKQIRAAHAARLVCGAALFWYDGYTFVDRTILKTAPPSISKREQFFKLLESGRFSREPDSCEVG